MRRRKFIVLGTSAAAWAMPVIGVHTSTPGSYAPMMAAFGQGLTIPTLLVRADEVIE